MAGHWHRTQMARLHVDPPQLTAYDSDPNPIIGRILDDRGNLVKQVRRGPERKIGFTQS